MQSRTWLRNVLILLAASFLLIPLVQAKPISAKVLSNLNLGVLTPGDMAASIPPGTSETAQNASIEVSGDRNTAFMIVLPSGSVELTTGNGGAARTITLSSFSSFPPAGLNGYLDNKGKATVYVGATRGALQQNQVPGNYTGAFTVTVTY